MSKVQIPTRKLAHKQIVRAKKKRKIRAKISGTQEIPRITIYKSLKHIHAQVINDVAGQTLVYVSTLQKDFSKTPVTMEGSKSLGTVLGKKMLEKKFTKAVFDRNGYKYHGVIKSFIEAVREQGITI